MTIALRSIDPTQDFGRIAEIISKINPEPVTAAELAEWDANRSPEAILQHTAAVDDADYIVGFGIAMRSPWTKPGKFWMEITVDPDHRRRGIGAQLYDNALNFTRSQGAACLEGEVRDHDHTSYAWAEQRGFKTQRHIFESTLDLKTFDETPFVDAISATEQAGFRFFTLADLADTEEVRHKLYTLNRATVLDIPGAEDGFPPFEQFQKFVFDASWYRADGQVVVANGDSWAGFAALAYNQETNSMNHHMTGVDRSYRGRGLTLPLKLLAIRCARKYSADYMRTNNDSQNAPMLAVNRKLGYRPEPGFYKLVRET